MRLVEAAEEKISNFSVVVAKVVSSFIVDVIGFNVVGSEGIACLTVVGNGVVTGLSVGGAE